MGAGHCPWCGFTDRNVCNMYMERYASRRAAVRCFGLGFFFQIWHFVSHPGTLPIRPDRSRGSLLSSYNIWQNAKYSCHAAKSTPPDPHRLWFCVAILDKRGLEHNWTCAAWITTWHSLTQRSRLRCNLPCVYGKNYNMIPTFHTVINELSFINTSSHKQICSNNLPSGHGPDRDHLKPSTFSYFWVHCGSKIFCILFSVLALVHPKMGLVWYHENQKDSNEKHYSNDTTDCYGTESTEKLVWKVWALK